MLPNTTAKWKMKNRKLSESAISLPSVDVNISHSASKMVMEMNEEAKIFCVGFFFFFSGYASTVPFQTLHLRLKA